MKKKSKKWIWVVIIVIILITSLLIFSIKFSQDCNVLLEGFLFQPPISAPPTLTEFNTSYGSPCYLDIHLSSSSSSETIIAKISSCFIDLDDIPFFPGQLKVSMRGKYVKTTVCSLLSKMPPTSECGEGYVFIPCEVTKIT